MEVNTRIEQVPLSWFGARLRKARRQKAAVEAVEQMGGSVMYDWERDPNRPDVLHVDHPVPSWALDLLGEDFFSNVTHVSASFSRAGDYREIHDIDLEHLRGLIALSHLDLSWTQVTDDGLEHLEHFTNLELLDVTRTNVTLEGVKKLQEALPNCEIEHGIELRPEYEVGETPPVVAESDTTIQVMTWPIVQNPRTCFPQRAVQVRLLGNKVLLDDVRLYKNRKPWLNEDRIGVQKGVKWGFCDSTGQIVIPPRYESIGPFAEGYAVVLVDKQYGYVKTDGSWLKEPQYEWACPFTMGLGLVKVGNRWGIIDRHGNWVEQPKFCRLDSLRGGIFAETLEGKTYWYRKDPELRKGRPSSEQ